MFSGTVVDTGERPEAKPKTVIKCPIDSEEFDTLEQLSKHMDMIHIGPGLLAAFGRESWGAAKK